MTCFGGEPVQSLTKEDSTPTAGVSEPWPATGMEGSSGFQIVY